MYVISTIQDSFVNVEGAVFSIFMHHGATKNRKGVLVTQFCAMRGGPCPKNTTQNSHTNIILKPSE
jgi:hypothetical protein